MAKKNETTNEVVVTKKTTDTGILEDGRRFWAKNGKVLAIVGAVIVLGLAGWFGYQKFVKEPNELKANELVFMAENLFDKMGTTGFNKDSVNIVINGGSLEGKTVTGLLTVANKYSGTDAGNRANYMVGASYLYIGEFDKAIKFLKEYSSTGATQVDIVQNQLLGHAYAEKKNTAEALSYYKKAAEVNTKDDVFTGNALLLAANYAASINNSDDAKSMYKKLKDDYPTNAAVVSGDVDKFLASLGEVE